LIACPIDRQGYSVSFKGTTHLCTSSRSIRIAEGISFANERVHDRFIAFGKAGLTRGIAIGRYVIMPDHIHLFVRGSLDFVLVQWMRILNGAYREQFTKRLRIGNPVSSII